MKRITDNNNTIKHPYIKPSIMVFSVMLENTIAASANSTIIIDNSTVNVNEDWGTDNTNNNDINFTN